MKFVQNTTAKVKNNALVSVAGGVAGFMIAKKMLKGKKNWYVLGASILVGVIAGANIGSYIKTKGQAPTPKTVEGKK
jgi:uncharacterized membrane protein YfcA